jgi:hypothetical protein
MSRVGDRTGDEAKDDAASGCDGAGTSWASIHGVDFSGARLAGRSTWLARLEPVGGRGTARSYRLVELSSLERLSGTPERGAALAHLVDRIKRSDGALWALDFPFGLPVEVMSPGCPWEGQFGLIREWGDDAYGLGVECLRRAKALGGPGHIRRTTDVEARAPFDCYHYRIIYQTFHGMRDVLGPLLRHRGTAILPFHYRRLPRARRVLVEACPSSTLKRLRLSHQNYKQPAGGPLTLLRRRTRRGLLDALADLVDLSDVHRRVIMRNPGGDALDAVVAALGAAHAWETCDHRRVARHPRYRREGRLYV